MGERVVLLDGTVFMTGGLVRGKPFRDATTAMVPELWEPVNGTWTKLNPMAMSQTYHYVAVLLPDATVFQGRGGLCGQYYLTGGLSS